MEHDCDVLIIGGGLVGSSLALALAQTSLRTILVEARVAGTALVDPLRERYLALSRASVNALTPLRVASHLGAEAGTAIRAIHVSRRGDFGRTLLKAEEAGVDRFGCVVPASQLGSALSSALAEAGNLERLAPATLVSMAASGDAVEAVVDVAGEQRRLTASVLVGADGSESAVREYAGLGVETHDYGQDALVFSVGIGRDHQGTAYERFTDEGAIAALPLPDRRVGLIWTLARGQARTMAEGSDQQLLDAVQPVFGHRLGRLHSPGRRVCHPLSRRWAPETVRGRVALVGNAAQTLHPIAAQGFNLGLRDALVLAEALQAIPDDPVEALRVHQQRRRRDRERIATLSHSLARWPKLSVPGLGFLRSAGLAAINTSPHLRQSLMLAGMGFGEDVPAWSLEPAA